MINTLIDLWANIPIAMLLISALAWVFINAEEPFDLATPLINTQAGLDMVNSTLDLNDLQRQFDDTQSNVYGRPLHEDAFKQRYIEEFGLNPKLPVYENPPKMPVIKPPSQPSKRL